MSRLKDLEHKVMDLAREVDDKNAELQRHKRAIEWCLRHGAKWSLFDRHPKLIDRKNDQLEAPSDIADLIKGQS